MRTKITHLGLALALLCPWAMQTARAQTIYTPVAVTGYNEDVIANGQGSVISSTTSTVDRGNAAVRWCFADSTFSTPSGARPVRALPINGFIRSITTPGLTYQLAPSSGPNSLRIDGASSGTLTLVTPQPCTEIEILATEGNGTNATDKTFTVFFTDGTVQVFNGIIVPDWYGGTITPAIRVGSRVNRGNTPVDGIENAFPNPTIYEVKLSLAVANYGKLVQSIGVRKTLVDPVLNIMGVSLGANCLGAPVGGAATANVTSVCPGAPVQLSLTGATVAGSITYQWQASTDGGVTYTNIAGATAATYTATPAVSTRYRAALTCRVQSTNSAPVAVTVLPTVATVAYPAGPQCLPAPNATLTLLPLTASPAGGVFSSTPGLTINASTGAVSLGTSTPGTYTVTYTLPNSCQAVGTTSLTLVRLQPTLAYGAPTYCRTGTSGAPQFGPAGGSFSSTAGLAINPTTGVIDLANSSAGSYTVSYVVGGACSATATATLVVKSDALPVFPNVITPNGDNQNEALRLKIADVTGYHIRVYNRWGRKVYEGYDAAQGWTAADNSAGMYYYQLSYTDCAGRPQEYKSWVEVVK